MPKTAHFEWDTPTLEEEADVPADLLSLATEIEETLNGLDVAELGTAGEGDAGKLLIVGSTGEAVWRALGGDATLASTGVITLINEAVTAAKLAALAVTEAKLAGESVATAKIKALAVTAAKLAAECVETTKIANLAVTEGKLAALAVSTAKIAELAVTTAKLANLCVTEGKIADGAVTSRKHKPTCGEKEASADKTLTEAFQEIAGCKLEITPAVPSILIVNAVFHIEVSGVAEPWDLTQGIGIISLDGDDPDSKAYFSIDLGKESVAHNATVATTRAIPLTAALHSITLRAKRGVKSPVKVREESTKFTYMLVAS